jgi:hypothetical protein
MSLNVASSTVTAMVFILRMISTAGVNFNARQGEGDVQNSDRGAPHDPVSIPLVGDVHLAGRSRALARVDAELEVSIPSLVGDVHLAQIGLRLKRGVSYKTVSFNPLSSGTYISPPGSCTAM